MHCPKCKNHSLKPKKLENGLFTLVCEQCKGSLLSVLHYIQWRESRTKLGKNIYDKILEFEETEQAIFCPKCTGFMTKYKVSNQTNNHLDLCFRCYETWLDAGEWQLLQQLTLETRLTEIFSPSWQKSLRKKAIKLISSNREKQLFGEEYGKIKSFKMWLEQQPHKEKILMYLQGVN